MLTLVWKQQWESSSVLLHWDDHHCLSQLIEKFGLEHFDLSWSEKYKKLIFLQVAGTPPHSGKYGTFLCNFKEISHYLFFTISIILHFEYLYLLTVLVNIQNSIFTHLTAVQTRTGLVLFIDCSIVDENIILAFSTVKHQLLMTCVASSTFVWATN